MPVLPTKAITLHPICYRSEDPMKEFMAVTMHGTTRVVLHDLGITLHCKHVDHRQATALANMLNESLTKVEVEKIW